MESQGDGWDTEQQNTQTWLPAGPLRELHKAQLLG